MLLWRGEAEARASCPGAFSLLLGKAAPQAAELWRELWQAAEEEGTESPLPCGVATLWLPVAPPPPAHWLLEAVFWGKQKALRFPLRKS